MLLAILLEKMTTRTMWDLIRLADGFIGELLIYARCLRVFVQNLLSHHKSQDQSWLFFHFRQLILSWSIKIVLSSLDSFTFLSKHHLFDFLQLNDRLDEFLSEFMILFLHNFSVIEKIICLHQRSITNYTMTI